MSGQSDGPYPKRLRQLHLSVAFLISALAISGLVFHFRKAIGLAEAKMTIVEIHAYFGYFLIAIFSMRLLLGFRSGASENISHVVPGIAHLRRLFNSRAKFAGRAPLSRLIATLIYAAIAFNIATGVVRAGTDLYHPPLGPLVLQYLSPNGEIVTVESAKAGNVDRERLKKLVKYKRSFAVTHYYAGLFIIFLSIAHALGVILTEWSPPGGSRARGRARLMLFGPEKK